MGREPTFHHGLEPDKETQLCQLRWLFQPVNGIQYGAGLETALLGSLELFF